MEKAVEQIRGLHRDRDCIKGYLAGDLDAEAKMKTPHAAAHSKGTELCRSGDKTTPFLRVRRIRNSCNPSRRPHPFVLNPVSTPKRRGNSVGRRTSLTGSCW
jgi:hypothetical protein